MTPPVTIQRRRDTAANWTSANPVLAQGEDGLETDTGYVKIGDGVSTWTALGYSQPSPSVESVGSLPAVQGAWMDALQALGRSDQTRSTGLQRAEYEDADQIAEDWADLAAWTIAVGAPAVSGGTLYCADASTDIIAQAFSPSDAGRGYLMTTLILPAGRDTAAGDGGSNFGIFLRKVPADGSTGYPPDTEIAVWLTIDLYSGAILFASDTDQTVALVQGNPPLTLSGSDPDYPNYPAVDLTDAQTLGMMIAWDENSVITTLMDEAHTWETRFVIPRSGATGIESVAIIVDSDTRGLSGAAIGPAFAKQGYASALTAASAPRAATPRIHYDSSTAAYGGGSIPTHPVSTYGTQSDIGLWVPRGYDSRVPAPLLIHCHGAWLADVPGEQICMQQWDPPSDFPAYTALSDDGVIVCTPALEGENMGNDAGLADLLAAYRYCRDRLNIGPVILAGDSMGGLTAGNALVRRAIPNVTGFLGFSPFLALMRLYGVFYNDFVIEGLPTSPEYNDWTEAFVTPYYVGKFGGTATTFAEAGPDYAVNIPYDPSLAPPGAARGVGILFLDGSADDYGFLSDAVAFVAKFGPYAREANVVTVPGAGHDANALWQGANIDTITSFVQRCAAA